MRTDMNVFVVNVLMFSLAQNIIRQCYSLILSYVSSCDSLRSGWLPLCSFPPAPPRLPHEEEGRGKLRSGGHQTFHNSLSQSTHQGVLCLNWPIRILSGVPHLPFRNRSINSWRCCWSLKSQLRFSALYFFHLSCVPLILKYLQNICEEEVIREQSIYIVPDIKCICNIPWKESFLHFFFI